MAAAAAAGLALAIMLPAAAGVLPASLNASFEGGNSACGPHGFHTYPWLSGVLTRLFCRHLLAQ